MEFFGWLTLGPARSWDAIVQLDEVGLYYSYPITGAALPSGKKKGGF